MPLLGYGEDALTLAAITRGLPSFLRQLSDATPPSDVLAFYRPSFGRRSGTENRRRSEFGEFDAIIGTCSGVYLVEAKWTASAELRDGALELRQEQLRRHRAMRQYIDDWRRLQPSGWTEFAEKARTTFEAMHPGLTIPSARTTLAANLEFVLRRLAPLGPVVDVVLVSAPGAAAPNVGRLPSGFRLVLFDTSSVGGAGYIDLGRPVGSPGAVVAE